jgi:hypothetical protein
MADLPMTFDQFATIGSAVGASYSAIAVLGWWLSGRFRRVEDEARKEAEKVAIKADEAIQRHELVDQRRHDENLANFQKIFVSLARNGLNGDRH